MKKFLFCACAASLSIAAISPCFAADSLFNGAWKYNEARSKLTGATVAFSQKANGMYHYSNGDAIEYDFACDGKSYPAIAERTVTCTGDVATNFDFTMSANGTLLAKWHNAISADGQTMTQHGTEMHVDGTTATFDTAFKRLSGSTGMAGKWKDVKDTVSGASAMIISISGDSIHLEFPADKSVVDCKLDGTDCPETGPTMPAGLLNSYKILSPTQISYEVKFKEKVLNEGVVTVNAGGKTLSDEYWTPGKKAEKTTLAYDKQ